MAIETELPSRTLSREAGAALADRIIAAQRRGAKAARNRSDRPRPPVAASQPGIIQRPPIPRATQDFGDARRNEQEPPRFNILKRGSPQEAEIARSGRGRGRGELYNQRGTSPVPAVKVYSGDEAAEGLTDEEDARRPAGTTAGSRQLFDPGRHDPVRFSSDSQSRTSSNGRQRKSAMHAYSSGASQSSTTDNSSAGEALASAPSSQSAETSEKVSAPQKQPVSTSAPRSNPLIETFRRSYRKITELEGKRVLEAENEQKGTQERPEDWVRNDVAYTAPLPVGPTKDDSYWLEAIGRHKELAEAYHAFLELSADPRLPASMHTLPHKYNIPTRLWQHAFYPMLQRLRRALPISAENREAGAADILSHLTEFIYFAYSFYTSLLEEPAFVSFRPAWLEQLGDLARYRMLIAGIVVRYQLPSTSEGRTLAANLPSLARKGKSQGNGEAQSDTRDSINSLALDAWDVEEQDTWRAVAREWYAKGLAETPGTGRLHHHLGLLSKTDDFRALYHFTRSLTASHPYVSAKESIRPTLEAPEERARRIRSDAGPLDVFVQLHSMLFTRIALDDFDEILGRFLERLRAGYLLLNRSSIDSLPFRPIGDVKWTMAATINIASLLQYGVEDSPLKRALVKKEPALTDAPQTAEVEEAPHAIMLNPASAAAATKPSSDGGSSDAGSDNGRLSPPTQHMRILSLGEAQTMELPTSFVQACRLTFDMLAWFCRHIQGAVPGHSKAPKPYLTVLLTFMIQIVQQPAAFELVERYIPWTALIELFNHIPKGHEIRSDPQSKLTSQPLPEDWCLRGADWTGRHVFGRGYWRPSSKAAKARAMPESEVDVLNIEYDPAIAAQHAQSDDGGYGGATDEALTTGRWKRIALAASWFIKCVSGIAYDQTHQRFKIVGNLQSRILRWAAEDQDSRRRAEKEKLVQEAQLQTLRDSAEQTLEVEEDGFEADANDEEHASDSEAVKELKSRRRHLRCVIAEAKANIAAAEAPAQSHRAKGRYLPRAVLQATPGFTILVFDTNILLNALPLFSALLESKGWTVVVPLAVVTELDGLAKNSEVGKKSRTALTYLDSHVKSHGMFLKIQTSRGNYLGDLAIRHESVHFAASGDGARNMDDVILRAAMWQVEHFTDRSSLFAHVGATEAGERVDAVKVALISFDRNLRVKARARGLHAATDDDLARLVLQVPSKSEADKG